MLNIAARSYLRAVAFSRKGFKHLPKPVSIFEGHFRLSSFNWIEVFLHYPSVESEKYYNRHINLTAMGTGSIAPNFYQGARSEYLARYVFSAFGTAVPVPRPEDSGIDLQCTLGTPKGKRLWIEDYYYVQIKSDKTDIVYTGRDSVEWLSALKLPLFFCLVNKKELVIEVFQTVPIHLLSLSPNLEKVVFTFNSLHNPTHSQDGTRRMFPRATKAQKEISIDLGKPILKIHMNALSSPEKVSLYKSVLKSWLIIQQRNIRNIGIGFELIELPEPWETNQPTGIAKRFNGNYFSIDPRNRRAYKDTLYKSLSTVLVEVGAKNDKVAFEAVRMAIAMILEKIENPFEMGTINLIFRENEIAKKLGLKPLFKNPKVNYSGNVPKAEWEEE